ncbi:hypothetical protein [Xanthomonas phage Olaya]|nr:hypothetical protein [Xanthomonas phage Olaya]QTZ82461.1 hypothetical protein [Xanthomonas phage Bolivar]QTZ82494.1 hypothetical protein [Xanthomonas phage Usaquen]QTZ82575.1 hypothetical protein [Xanthomonas phage Alcala]QTZ82628.1 hypothetical protein [Xanthomonas phage Fontebon]QTZ82668.1 hypothetical protein [Xanthomonas phage Soumapaz]CAA2366800.1 hypothetical protein [Xylella phage Usme]
MTHEIDPATEQDQDATTAAKAGALALRTAAMQELESVEAGLADLAAKYKGVVFDVTTTKGMDEAKAARAAIREPRYKAENIRKEKTSQLSKLGKEINERAGTIKDAILAIEDPIDKQIKAEEDRKEQEREAKRQAEAERIGAMNARLDNIRNMPLQAVGASAAELQQAIDRVAADELDGFDEVYLPTAQQTRDTALDALRKMLAERQALDEQAAQLERQRQEQAARDAEAAEQRRIADEAAQAERDRLAAEAQAKADAEAKARREQQEKEDAERAARLAEEDRLRAEQAEADRVERERVQAEQAERQAELDRQAAEQRQRDDEAAQAQREAQEKADQERRDREAAEQAAAEQERAQAEAEAYRRAAMLFIVNAPDGSRWAVPVLTIARDRAKHYASEFDGDVERSLDEDTMPLFEASPYEVQDWAVNNMNWSDVKPDARIYAPAKPITDDDMQEAWMSGDKEVLIPAVQP